MQLRRIAKDIAVLDFPVMLSQMMGAGVTSTEIAEILGVSPSAIRNYASDRIPPPKGWDEGIAVLHLYMMTMEQQPPTIRGKI